MSQKKQLLLAIIGLFLLGLMVTGGSYAFWVLTDNNTKAISFNSSSSLTNYIEYDAGESKFVGDFNVSSTYNNGIHSTIGVNKTSSASNIPMIASINMDINAIGNNMKISSALKWVVTEGTTSNIGDVLAHGNFIGANNGDTLTLVPNIEVTTTKVYYTIWIWLDASENPSDLLSGETLDTVVWTQIDQSEGVSGQYAITRINANYQEINATVVSNEAKITDYAVTTTNTEPSDWTSIPLADQSYVYNLSYDAPESDTYYIWFKNEDNKVISRTVTVNSVDTTAPSCSFGSWSANPISNEGTATIELTCTDAQSTLTVSNLKVSDLTKSGNSVSITNMTKTSVTNGYKYTITVTGTANEGSSTITLPAGKIKNAVGLGNSSVTSSSMQVINEYTATFKYQSNATSGSQTISTLTESCALSGGSTACTITIPSAVLNSVGKYNNEYAGLANNYGTMNADVAKTSTTITLSGDQTYYATYSSQLTIYYPDSLSTCTSISGLYRNQWFSSANDMVVGVIANSSTGRSSASLNSTPIASSISGYGLKKFNRHLNSYNNGYGSIVSLASSSDTVLYVSLQTDVTGTFYYNSSTVSDGTYTVATATATAQRYLCCQTVSTTSVQDNNYTVPDAVLNSVGPYGQGIDSQFKIGTSMTTNTPNTTYNKIFTIYTQDVQFYYYDNSYKYYRSRPLKRLSFFPNENGSIVEDTLDTVLSFASSADNINYSIGRGPGNSILYGLSTGQDTTREYSTVDAAAHSTETTLYVIYSLGVKYTKGSNVSRIGSATGECLVTTPDTSCDVTLPTITPNTGYTVVGWSTTNGDTTGTDAGGNYSVSTNGLTLYANAVDDTPPSGTLSMSFSSNTVTATANITDAGSGVASAYGWKVSSSSTCDSTVTGFVDTAVNTYSFNISTSGTQYVCARVEDNDGNIGYIGSSVEVVGATFYYNSDATSGSETISTETEYCIISSPATTCTLTIPSSVTSSVGTYNNDYYGLSLSTGNMTAQYTASNTTATISADTSYYALYSTAVTNYYYSSSYTIRTIYRNQYFTSTSAMANTVLATANTGTTNYTTETGPGSSTWAGLSTAQDTTPEYATVATAAASTETILYTVYQLGINYAIGSNVSSIGSSSGSCNITTGDTSCSVTLPTINASSCYISVGWGADGATTGTSEGDSYTISSNGDTLYANGIGETTLYVSSSGSDSAAGTSTSLPFATIAKAYSCPGNITIKLLSDITQTSQADFNTTNKSVTLTSNTGTYTITRGSSFTSGNLIALSNGNTLTLTNIAISGNNVNNSQTLIRLNGSTVNLNSGTTLRNSISSSSGGAISAFSSSTLNVNGATLRDNQVVGGGSGGAINVSASTLNMSSGTLSNNTVAQGNGGAIALIQSSTFNMTGGTITTNTASNIGGGVLVDSSSNMYMSNAIVESNVANGGHGGGISVWGSAYAEIKTGSIIRNNTAYTNGGGGIGVVNSRIAFRGGTVTGNNAANNGSSGGGIECAADGGYTWCSIESGTITDNNAAYSGGGLSVWTVNGGTIDYATYSTNITNNTPNNILTKFS